MRDFFEIVAPVVLYVCTVIVIIVLLAIFALFVFIGVMGTGPLTANPPPEDIRWLGILIAFLTWLTLQWGVARLHRLLISALDRFALRQ